MGRVCSIGTEVRAWTVRIVRWQPSPGVRRLLLGASCVVFLTAVAFAASQLSAPDLVTGWLVLASGLTLFVPLLNALGTSLPGGAAKTWLYGRCTG